MIHKRRGALWFSLAAILLALTPPPAIAEPRADWLEERLIEGMDLGILGDYQGAVLIFSELIQTQPDYAEAYFNRGVAWERLNRWPAALADYSRAIERDPQLAEAYHRRGRLWRQRGDRRLGQRDLRQAAELYRRQNNVSALEDLQREYPDLQF
ncbi:MAG: tetratricopeptide repeat protein [Cyanobacteria bacterium RI_101]|nr:tetratricopeptide repeat protein [Cyanobacteria bacterium RI_101]